MAESNAKIEIIVLINDVKYYLDNDGVNIPLNYQISDIQDISTRKASSSLTITLPETSNNRYIFNSISDLSVDLQYFNPNKKAPVWVLADSIQVFRGNLQLTSVDVDIDKNNAKYNCVVYSESDDFFKSMGESLLSDLDFGEFDHKYDVAAITASWYGDYNDGYFYGLMDYTGDLTMAQINGNTDMIVTSITGQTSSIPAQIQVKNFYPQTYIKAIWDRIFQTVGYTYESDFLYSDKFKNLLFPYSGQTLLNSQDFLDSLLFKVGTTASYSINYTLSNFGSGNFGMRLLNFDNYNDPYLNNGQWNLNTYTNTNSNIGQQFGFNLKVGFVLPSASSQPDYQSIILRVCRSKDPTTGLDVPNWNGGNITDILNYPRIPFAGSPTSEYSISSNEPSQQGYYISQPSPYLGGQIFTASVFGITDALDNRPSPGFGIYYTPLFPGEEVRYYLYKWTGTNIYSGEDLVIIDQSSYVYNKADRTLQRGQTMSYSTVMPINLKQKDFITSIVKLFNLYIEPSKEYPNKLVIEPRNEYYEQGETEDWSEKVDISKPIKEKILAETQNKSILFTYKKDTDFYNTDYESKLKRIYGDLRYVIDNDFTSGEKKIETVFSPTPLTKLDGSESFIIPQIFKLNNGRKQKYESMNYRILSRNTSGLIDLSVTDQWIFEGTTYDKYPYVGHFDHPTEPSYDINHGQSYLYYEIPNENITNNNLFTNYWKNTMDEISDINSRIITLQMFLSPEDIYQFKFNKNIFLLIDGVGGYYKVNKISGYDPTQIRTCTVEFLKTIDTHLSELVTTNTISQNVQVLSQSTKDVNKNLGGVWTSADNISGSIGTIINGWDNTTGDINININGIGNFVSSKNTTVNGNGNFVSFGDNKIIFGDNNIESSNGSNNVFMLGNNNYTYNSSDVYFVGITGSTISYFGINDIYILGSNVTASNIHNTYVFGSNINATQSDTIYINLPIQLGPSGSIRNLLVSDGSGGGLYVDNNNNILTASQSNGLTFSIFRLTSTQSTFQYQDNSTPLTSLLTINKLGVGFNGSLPVYINNNQGSLIINNDVFVPGAAQNNLFFGLLGSIPTYVSGQFNIIVSLDDLTALTTGSSNILISPDSYDVTTGSANVAIGRQSGTSLTTGGFNTLVGAAAGGSFTTDSQQTAIGYAALQSASGGFNTAVGYGAGSGINSGDGNTFVGLDAGVTNDVSNSTFIGNASGAFTSGSNNTLLGYSTHAGAKTDSIVLGADAQIETSGPNGQLVLGSGTSPLTISGTASGIVPAQYIYIVVNGTQYKLPLYDY